MASAVIGAEAQAAAEHEQHGHERDDLLVHVFERAERGECQADEHDDDARAARGADERADQPGERAGGVEQRERAADEQDGQDDIRARRRCRAAPSSARPSARSARRSTRA